MGYFYGSIRHTTSGRKKSKPQRGRRNTYKPAEGTLELSQPYRRETPHYPSASTKVSPNETASPDSFRREISSKYTIAPAYNKGAYQVISLENVKDIGK